MLSPSYRTRLQVVLAALLPVLLGLGIVLHPRLNPELELFQLHALLVGTVAVLALLVTVTIGMIGLRQRNVQVLLLSLASASLALVYAVHGLASPETGAAGISPMIPMHVMPGMDSGYSAALPVASQLGVLLTAFWLCFKSFQVEGKERVRRPPNLANPEEQRSRRARDTIEQPEAGLTSRTTQGTLSARAELNGTHPKQDQPNSDAL
jgi:hypothetical protein